ncbi:helix-turn-helix domain-containing protein [Actinoallomurus iriomotensis]|uniref:AraC family transcriptional regulator n=1 Tax=Actinoallomurus iriomotensis TaxID=478107 RepID=A0A9W6VYG7_9ACTN|nr:helix-turn-helix domain-containing protein [Actinoallomurus iriomotensis]GLY90053.1 AraC family transcriptional regulator [Actinoallomurus iriomotensis]
MLETIFRSDDLPVADRFDRLRELMSLAPVPMDASSRDITDLLVRQRDLHFDSLRVWRMTFHPMTFHRTKKLIRHFDPETYNACLLLNGAMKFTWGRQEATYGPGELHISDSSRPFELRARSTDGAISCVGIEVPKRLLPRDRADRVVGRPICGTEGVGALLAQFLTHLTTESRTYRPTDGPRMGLVATDLLLAVLGHLADDDDDGAPPPAHRQALILRIHNFIRHHLGDPHLTPRAIASAHHISLSYLHRLFQGEQFTVAACIRHQRMEHARRDLADRAMYATPIYAIAARWGFSRATDFTRAFRAAYGISPTDYRRQALRGAMP